MGYRSSCILLFDHNNTNVNRLLRSGLSQVLHQLVSSEEYVDLGNEKSYTGFRFDGWKWYSEHPEIKYLLACMNWLDKHEEDYISGYIFIRFGEVINADTDLRGDTYHIDMMDIDACLTAAKV
jgi:hypothetical protein